MKYIQPNISIAETIDIIKDAIKNETPLCLTRFGDGEIKFINNKADPAFNRKNCNLWGYEYPSEVQNMYNDCLEILHRALKGSDILGFMSKDTPVLPKGFYKERDWSLPINVLEDMGCDFSHIKICDGMISRSKSLGNIHNFKNILDGRDLHIISMRKSLLDKRNLSKILDCEVTITDHPSSINFNNRTEFIDSFKHIKPPVVILGVGLQKDYGVYLKDDYGKIAIDLGATLDAWAGLITRPWFTTGNCQDYLVI